MERSPKAYQIKITLKGIHPPVWRRILVADKMSLLELHEVLQDVFGWQDYHLHQFTIDGVFYGNPRNDEFGELNLQDETRITLKKLDLPEGSDFLYEYDFGDGWEHTLRVEKILPAEKGTRLPRCLAGRRACPPEDVGGPWGYEGFLEAIHDPGHAEHASYLEWIGGEFDPEGFDLETANERLHGSSHREPEDQPVALPDPSRLARLLSAESEQAAQDLPLRRDAVAFLNYLRENKVTGTASTGNLPRKVVEEVSARFVNPPQLETRIGDTVFRFRTEEEVWPIHLVHTLAQVAALIEGGPGRRLRLTRAGEEFLGAAVGIQVWILFATWWYRVNWLIAYPIAWFGDDLPERFLEAISALLRDTPPDPPTPFGPFADRLTEAAGWTRRQRDPDNDRMTIHAGIERMVIEPLESFGVLTARREPVPDSLIEISRVVSLALTDFGRVLLDTIS